EDARCGSGAIWPLPGRPLVSTRERMEMCRPAPPPFTPTLASGDGRVRAFVVLLDSAEWRLVRFLQAREELPTLSFMEATGVSGPINSNPPFTAAALKTILFPRSQGEASVLSLMHGLGREIEGLNFIGANPLASLRWLLPQERDLLETLGAGDRRIAGLLRSFGSLESGRKAEIVGPGGRHELLEGFSGSRSLRDDERQEFFAHTTMDSTAQGLLREMAADFDTLDHLVEKREVDLVLLRVASMDVMTHTFLLSTNRPDQNPSDDFLLSAYRYADRRLGDLYSNLDGDDVLIVLSDHGAKTALQHEESAIFFVAGGQVPHQTLVGDPSIRGLGRLLADLWNLDLDLPSTGLESWLTDSEGQLSSEKSNPPVVD
ncbi:MAG: alkaline phosphatase family protein, partial [Thermoanaerobaculia bacterium]|nr:alkaline phosphatase family protein [Thermoanaerobaculia bacterium]